MNATAPSTLALAMVFAVGLSGCPKLQAAAAKDPMRCERDPGCAEHNRSQDCSLQCNDDPACMQRCEEVRATSPAGNLGH